MSDFKETKQMFGLSLGGLTFFKTALGYGYKTVTVKPVFTRFLPVFFSVSTGFYLLRSGKPVKTVKNGKKWQKPQILFSCKTVTGFTVTVL